MVGSLFSFFCCFFFVRVLAKWFQTRIHHSDYINIAQKIFHFPLFIMGHNLTASQMDLDLENIFQEPESFRPEPPKESFVDYERVDNKGIINLRLVGASPLWGHLLWNAGKYTANYLDQHPELYRDKNVLELGAAAALPSLICGLNGAAKVVSTDYPDPDLLYNIQYNVDHCASKKNIVVKGYIWGNDYEELQKEVNGEKFDLIILSDVVFNHTEHLKLLRTTKDLLAKDGRCFVVFSPHRPHLLDQDLKFFDIAEEQFQFKVDRHELVNWKPMFEEDEETVEIRSRIYSYFLTL